jgi:hypothetical protein
VTSTARRSNFLQSEEGSSLREHAAATMRCDINGIERSYQPLHVQPGAAPGASRRAAVVQAAYATLVKLVPAQLTDLDNKRTASLAGIASEEAADHSKSIARGIEWGQEVADAIWAWRSTDGFSAQRSPFTGAAAPGQWRPTPPANAPMAALNFAFMTPWLINSPFQFPLPGPPAMTSDKYLADFNEVKRRRAVQTTFGIRLQWRWAPNGIRRCRKMRAF